MADNTIILQGNFTSTGGRKVIPIRSDVDWMYVYNVTALSQGVANLGATFYWQRGMAPGSGIVETILGAVASDPLTIGALPAGTGFTLINQGFDTGVSAQIKNSIKLSAPIAFTAVTDATQPVVTTADTFNLQDGDVVYLSQAAAAIDANNLLGIPFQVDTVVLNTSFRIRGPLDQAPGNAGTNGFWRRLVVPNTFYPEIRYIINIVTAGAVGTMVATPFAPVIFTSVDSGYQIGQEVTFNVPSALNGMTEINTLSAPVIHLDPAVPAAFQVRLDVSAFTPFDFPLNADLVPLDGRYTPATVVPAGMNSAEALAAIPPVDFLSDASVNQLVLGMQLSGGNTTANQNAGPAGAVGDVMFWRAGKSFSVDNTI